MSKSECTVISLSCIWNIGEEFMWMTSNRDLIERLYEGIGSKRGMKIHDTSFLSPCVVKYWRAENLGRI